MTPTSDGSCLCGTVKFRVSGAFESFFLCHCKRCRKDTGSAHAANLFSSTATLDWISGHESIQSYRVPETRHEKSFCVKCGSALPSVQLASEQLGGTLVVVPAGSIDSEIDMPPGAHVCFASRADWYQQLESLPKMDGLPG